MKIPSTVFLRTLIIAEIAFKQTWLILAKATLCIVIFRPINGPAMNIKMAFRFGFLFIAVLVLANG